jgi:pre-mRNA-splicing factor 18
MDLASLKAEIERKRKNVESMNVLLPEKKCFRRGDLEAKHEEAYWKNYYAKSDDNSTKATSSTDDTNEKTIPSNEKFQLPPRIDVIKKLRERNQPIRLFGEVDLDSYRRLRLLETTEPELKGQRNDFKAGLSRNLIFHLLFFF